jgi:hypothetical protein
MCLRKPSTMCLRKPGLLSIQLGAGAHLAFCHARDSENLGDRVMELD